MRERATVFAALLGVLAIVSGLGVGLIGYLSHAENEGAQLELAARSGADLGLEVSLIRGEDAKAQDALVRELLAAQFTNGDRQIPISIDRTVIGAAEVKVRQVDGERIENGASAATVLSVPNLPERATLVDGNWPVAPDEVSVQADAAVALGLSVASRFALGDGVVTVAATWRASDPLDPRWLSDPLVAAGVDDDDVGPIVVDEEAWQAIGMQARSRWTITPVADQIHSSDLGSIAGSWNGTRAAVRDAGIDTTGYDDRGRLARTALQVQSRVDALRAVEPVALLIIGAVALVTIIQLARLLGALRASELLLMWSRGATARGLAIGTAVETTIVSSAGAAIGAGGAVLVLDRVVGGSDAVLAAGAAVWLVPLAAAITAVAILSGMTFFAARSFSRMDKPDEAGRVRRAAGPGAVVLVTVAAVLSTWQLLLYGSPLTPSRDGGSQVDPIAVIAPALALVSLALLALLAVPLATPLTERAARRTRGVSRALVFRTLVRRVAIAATPLVVLALATGQIVLAASYSQTWNQSYTVTTELRNGSELRVTGIGDDLAPSTLARLPIGGGVLATAPVHQDTIVVGLDSASLVAASPAAIRDLATRASGLFDPAAAAENMVADLSHIPIPDGVKELRVTVESRSLESPPALSVVLADAYGSTRTLALDENYRVTLPELAHGIPGTWRVTGFELTVTPLPLDMVDPRDSPTVEITELATESGDALELGEVWSAVWIESVPSPLAVPGERPGVELADGVNRVRLVPAVVATPPIVISQALANRNSIEVGNSLFLPLDPREGPMPFVVSSIVAAIPGAQSDAAALVDLGVLQAIQSLAYAEVVTPRQIWVDTDDETAAMASLRAELPAGVRVQSLAIDPSREILQSGSITLWVGGVGAALLALVAVGAVLGAELGSRRPEALLLKALGLGSRSIARLRGWELGTALSIGTVVGLAAGFVVTLLTVAALARAAVPAPYSSVPTTPEVDLGLLVTALGGLVALSALLVAGYVLAVSNQVKRLSTEDTR